MHSINYLTIRCLVTANCPSRNASVQDSSVDSCGTIFVFGKAVLLPLILQVMCAFPSGSSQKIGIELHIHCSSATNRESDDGCPWLDKFEGKSMLACSGGSIRKDREVPGIRGVIKLSGRNIMHTT